MKALLFKQFQLVCHPMTLLFTLFGVMLLIPSYPYTVVFFYVTLGLFFAFMKGREQRDRDFTAVLPVRKRDTVRSAVWFSVIIQLLSLVLTVPFAVLSAHINPQGGNIVGLDANVALFAAGFVVYGIFNFAFFPALYRTGDQVGVSFVKSSIALAVTVAVLEALPHFPGLLWLNETTAAANLRQLPLLAVGAALGAVLTFAGCRIAEKRYEKVDL